MLSFMPGLPPDYSSHGHLIDHMIGSIHILMLVLGLGWALYFLYALYRFRASANPVAQYRGIKAAWVKWVIVAIVVVEGSELIGFSIPRWAALKTRLPDTSGALHVRIVAQQFQWNIHYPGRDGVFGRTSPDLVSSENSIGLDRKDPAGKDDIVTVNQLHLVADRMVYIRLTSLDVIHNLNLPYYRIKADAIPGLSAPVWFTPTGVSKGEIACAQLCGLGHYRMRGYVTVETQADFDKWMAEKEAELSAY